MKKKYFAAGLIAVPCALLMTGCSTSDLFTDKYDESTTKTAKSSKQAVADGLLPNWVPEGGSNIELVQRNTGSERIFVMDFDGKLPAEKCVPIKKVGQPSEQELTKAYASDSRTAQWKVDEISTQRTLDADWWPADAESRTTDLCGRFWVHQEGGKLYAFAPDSVNTVKAINEERKSASESK